MNLSGVQTGRVQSKVPNLPAKPISGLHDARMRVEWDDSSLDEIDEAKSLFIQARLKNRRVVDEQGNPVASFRPALELFFIEATDLSETQFAMRIFDETGDRRLIWDSRDPDQIKEAAKNFDEMTKKGWKAYAIDSEGNHGRRIHRFDADTEEVYFDEKDTRSKLQDFVKKFKEIKVVPRTFPG